MTETPQRRAWGVATAGRPPRQLGRWFIAAAVMGLLTVTLLASAAAAPPGLPDVDIVLVAQVQDSAAWMTLHRELLGTLPDSPKALSVSLPAGTGGTRSLNVERPKFSVEITTYQTRTLLKVSVAGKVAAAEALGSLTAFEHAALEVQAGTVRNEMSMVYGLAIVPAQLLELYLARP